MIDRKKPQPLRVSKEEIIANKKAGGKIIYGKCS